MRFFNSFAVLAKISLVILVLKLTITVNNGEVRVVQVGRVISKVVCQGETVKLKCVNASLAMVIYTASYGRKEEGRILCPFVKEKVDQSVIHGNDTDDSAECPEKNVTLEIMKLCDKRRRCIITVNETYFANHCKGIYKILKVIYACGVVEITVQVNGTNYTLPPSTVPTTVKTRIVHINDKTPSPKGVSSAAPAVLEQQSPAAVMGVAGSLYLWFLHMKENKSTYVTVFILSALGAALIMVGVVACFVTLQKKKEFLKLDIIHKPKRVLALPKEAKITNQNGHVPGKNDKVPDGEEVLDGTMFHKGPEVVFTAQDVSNQIKKEFNIDRYSGMENGTVHKGDAASVHVNPMFNSGNKNNNPNGMADPNHVILAGNETVSSLPSTPARGRSQTEPRSGTPRRVRANSTGNVTRSHERHHSQEITNYPEERVRLPRHLSAGNVSHQNRQAVSKNQSPSRTLPRQRSATGNDPYCQSLVRNPLHMHPEGNAQPATTNGTSYPRVIYHASQPQSPGRPVQNGAVVNQSPATSGTLNNRQQSQGPPSRSPQYSTLGQPVKQVGPGIAGMDGEPNYRGNPLSVASRETQSITTNSLPHQRTNPSIKLSNSSNGLLGREANPEVSIPYSAHRNTPKSSRKWSEDKPSNGTVPNITTNPNFSNRSGDIWQKHHENKLRQKEPSARSLSSDHSNKPEGILQRRRVSSETSTTQEQDASKGTLRPPSMGELLSPLDALPDVYASNPSLRFSEWHSYNNNPGTSTFHPSPPSPPSPPEQPTDSSDDDLYSIVAKGTYSSAVPDPYVKHTAGAMWDGREGKNKNKHVYVVVPSGDGSTAV